MATCRDCGAAIQFCRTAKSVEDGERRFMPLDPDPTPEGTVAIDAHGHAVVVGKDHPLHEGELYIAHQATCPARPEPKPKRRRRAPRRDTGDGIDN